MTLPRHHVPEEQLLAYGAGALGTAESVFVATHLALCPACRDLVATADVIGGALLADLPSEPVHADLRARVLAMLDEPEPEEAPLPPPPPADDPPRIPRPLRDYTGPLSRIGWAWSAPGIQTAPVGALRHGSTPVRLFRLAPGREVPAHTHDGMERALVLTGGYTDSDGHFERGDVGWRDGSADHHAVIDPGEPCVVLFVNDGWLVPRSWLTRLASNLIRL